MYPKSLTIQYYNPRTGENWRDLGVLLSKRWTGRGGFNARRTRLGVQSVETLVALEEFININLIDVLWVVVSHEVTPGHQVVTVYDTVYACARRFEKQNTHLIVACS